MAFTKSDMIKSVMDSSGCSEVMATKIVSDLLERMEVSLLEGEKVLLSGIGSIEPKQRDKIVKKHFGVETVIQEKIKLTLNTSRVFLEKYRKGGKHKKVDFLKIGEIFKNKANG